MVHNAVGEASVRDFSVDEATLDVIFANGESSQRTIATILANVFIIII